MNVVVGSAFRNSVHYLPRYFRQVEALRQHLGPKHKVRVLAAEGDSTDRTRDVLLTTPHVEVVDASHGGPVFGSTEEQNRMVMLSRVGNDIFSSVRSWDNVLVYIESDLIWDAPTIATLIDRAINRAEGFDVFAPLVFAGEAFYDIWGFRKNGVRFIPFPPYHAGLNGTLTEVDSAGSCLVMKSVVAYCCRIRNNYCLVGWCEDAREQHFRIAACSDLKIYHP